MHAHLPGPRYTRRAVLVWGGLALWGGAIPESFCARAAADLPEKATSVSRRDGVIDLAGREQDPWADPSARAVVLIFISIECPICNRYAPEIQRLQARFSKQDVVFWLVQPTLDETTESTRKHLEEYGYSLGLLRDTKRTLVNLAGATITPEAAVFAPGGRLIYHGRIDDRFADFGKSRPAPTTRELTTVLEEFLANRPLTVTHAPAVGCSIPR